MIKLHSPIKDFNWKNNVSQMFGVNYELYHTNFGTPGHNGIDIVVRDNKRGYGTPILAAHDGTVVLITYETKWKTKGNGLYLMDTNGHYQTIYWHLSEIQVVGQQKVKAGEVIGLMGNTGFCRPIPSPLDPYAGTHLHFALKDNHAKDKSYAGFVDPVPFLFNEGEKLNVYWPEDLFVGKSGDYVSWLQTILKIEGFAEDYEPIAYYGIKTARDVRKLQLKYSISPALGYFGPKTRGLMKEKYYY